MVYHRIIKIQILQQSILSLIITPSPQFALEIQLASCLFCSQGFEIFLEEKALLCLVSNVHKSLNFNRNFIFLLDFHKIIAIWKLPSLSWLYQGHYQPSLVHFQPFDLIGEHNHIALLVQVPFLPYEGRSGAAAAANEAEAEVGSPILGVFKSIDLIDQNTMITIIGHEVWT